MSFTALLKELHHVRQVSVITDDDMRDNYLQETYVFNGWENQPPFVCAMQGASNQDSFTITVVGTEATISASMLRSPYWQDSLLFRYAPHVIEMQRTFEGKLYEPLDNIRKKTAIFLAGYRSYLERGGAPVDVATLPVDWRARPVKPDWIDESMFKS